ncbi:cellulose binding domain-containing protein [Sorangium sp. So ce1182]|uniref:cellulose binding domain-containing protein n=1 Tax=Sorangium sp. So ce1182 TaxID=3133334 RepID=UPI003F621997
MSSTSSTAAGGGGSPTSTTTATTGGGPTGELELHYAARDGAARVQGLSFRVRVRNTGDETIALSDVTIRYWFTDDGATSTFMGACDFASVPGGYTSVTRTFGEASAAEADRYLELGFTSAAGTLAPGATSGEAQIRVYSATYESMMQTNDYSFDASLTELTPWEQVTAYRDGVLAWGTEP